MDSLINGRKTIYEKSNISTVPLGIWGMNADNTALITSIDDGERDGLYFISIEDGSITPYDADGIDGEDVGLVRDRFTNHIVGYGGTDDIYEQVFTDTQLEEVQDDVSQALGGMNVRLTSWSRDRRHFAISANAPGVPRSYYLYDANAKTVLPVGGVAPMLADTTLGTITKITYAAGDGLEIPAYMTLPPGKTEADGPFPLLMLPHGGPEARDTANYDWLSQSYAAEGYIVLQPNFRGSAGYGAEFRSAGYGEFGGLMVQDVIDGAAYLKTEGLARPEGYCVLGVSYGGYSAYMVAIMDNSNVGCSVPIAAVSDPFDLIGAEGSTSIDYWENYMGGRFGTDEAKSSITPNDRVAGLTMPVLVIHGREDTTVPYSQAESMKRAAQGRDNIRFLDIDGEDHYMGSTAVRRQVLRESIAFIAEHHPAK